MLTLSSVRCVCVLLLLYYNNLTAPRCIFVLLSQRSGRAGNSKDAESRGGSSEEGRHFSARLEAHSREAPLRKFGRTKE